MIVAFFQLLLLSILLQDKIVYWHRVPQAHTHTHTRVRVHVYACSCAKKCAKNLCPEWDLNCCTSAWRSGLLPAATLPIVMYGEQNWPYLKNESNIFFSPE